MTKAINRSAIYQIMSDIKSIAFENRKASEHIAKHLPVCWLLHHDLIQAYDWTLLDF